MQKSVYDLISDEIKRSKDGEEFYKLDFPNHREAISEFLEKNNIIIKENELVDSEDTKISVDEDGYPYVRNTIMNADYDIKVTVIAFHHSKWDFYFENIENI